MAINSNKKTADEKLKLAFEEHYVSLYRYCLSKLKNNEMAEDCVQEAFLVLYNKFLSNEEIIYIKAFLMKSAQNFILKKCEEIRKNQNTVSIEEIINIPLPDEDIDDRLTFEEYSRQISSALSTLDARIFTKRYVDEQKIEDIAKDLDMSLSAVTTRLSRIRNKLKKIFSDTFK